jgi:hypothetical protein
MVFAFFEQKLCFFTDIFSIFGHHKAESGSGSVFTKSLDRASNLSPPIISYCIYTTALPIGHLFQYTGIRALIRLEFIKFFLINLKMLTGFML